MTLKILIWEGGVFPGVVFSLSFSCQKANRAQLEVIYAIRISAVSWLDPGALPGDVITACRVVHCD